MRKKYELHQQGETYTRNGKITQEQIDKLNEAGFVWDTGFTKPKHQTPILPWEERFAHLVEYKRINGHTNVPRSVPELGNFVHSQRRACREQMKGKKSTLTTERLTKLTGIGFNFAPSNNGANASSSKRSGQSRARQPDSSDDDDDDGRQVTQHRHSAEHASRTFAPWDRFRL
jgi:hypothetical protein